MGQIDYDARSPPTMDGANGMSETRESSGSTVLGFALAPLGAAVTLWLILGATHPSGFRPTLLEHLAGLWDVTRLVMLVGYIAGAVVGLPLHFALRRRANRRLLAYCLAGVATGVAPFVLYTAIVALSELRHSTDFSFAGDVRFGLVWAAIAVPCGIVAEAVFWLVSIRPSPTEES
jgi:hypothetical protein